MVIPLEGSVQNSTPQVTEPLCSDKADNATPNIFRRVPRPVLPLPLRQQSNDAFPTNNVVKNTEELAPIGIISTDLTSTHPLTIETEKSLSALLEPVELVHSAKTISSPQEIVSSTTDTDLEYQIVASYKAPVTPIITITDTESVGPTTITTTTAPFIIEQTSTEVINDTKSDLLNTEVESTSELKELPTSNNSITALPTDQEESVERTPMVLAQREIPEVEPVNTSLPINPLQQQLLLGTKSSPVSILPSSDSSPLIFNRVKRPVMKKLATTEFTQPKNAANANITEENSVPTTQNLTQTNLPEQLMITTTDPNVSQTAPVLQLESKQGDQQPEEQNVQPSLHEQPENQDEHEKLVEQKPKRKKQIRIEIDKKGVPKFIHKDNLLIPTLYRFAEDLASIGDAVITQWGAEAQALTAEERFTMSGYLLTVLNQTKELLPHSKIASLLQAINSTDAQAINESVEVNDESKDDNTTKEPATGWGQNSCGIQ